MTSAVRSLEQRTLDTRRRLEQDVDAWVATTDEAGGAPYLIPLSFLWEGATLVISTPAASPTARNLLATGRVRLGLGPTRDVILIEGSARALDAADITPELGDAFAAKTGFDPRQLATPYRYFRIWPQRIQAWREADELTGRDLMRDGCWLIER